MSKLIEKSFLFVLCICASSLSAKIRQDDVNQRDEFILCGLEEKRFENIEATFHLPGREYKSSIKNLQELAKSMKDYGASIATLTLNSKEQVIVSCESGYGNKSIRQFMFVKVSGSQEDEDFRTFVKQG